MYLTDCPKDTYFEITEIWFHYEDKIKYSKKGIDEGKVIYVVENDGENIIKINSEIPETKDTSTTIFNPIDAMQIYGNFLEKKPKQKTLHK